MWFKQLITETCIPETEGAISESADNSPSIFILSLMA